MSVKKILNDNHSIWVSPKTVTVSLLVCLLAISMCPVKASAESSFFFIEALEANADSWVLIDEEEEREAPSRQQETQEHLVERKDSPREKTFDGTDAKWL